MFAGYREISGEQLSENGSSRHGASRREAEREKFIFEKFSLAESHLAAYHINYNTDFHRIYSRNMLNQESYLCKSMDQTSRGAGDCRMVGAAAPSIERGEI